MIDITNSTALIVLISVGIGYMQGSALVGYIFIMQSIKMILFERNIPKYLIYLIIGFNYLLVVFSIIFVPLILMDYFSDILKEPMRSIIMLMFLFFIFFAIYLSYYWNKKYNIFDIDKKIKNRSN